jgi:hypothetical protein
MARQFGTRYCCRMLPISRMIGRQGLMASTAQAELSRISATLTPHSFGSDGSAHLPRCRGARAGGGSSRSSALSTQNLGDAGACANDLLQVPSREPLLLHAELNGLNGVRRVHRMVLRFIGVDEGRKHIQAVTVGGSRLRGPALSGSALPQPSCCTSFTMILSYSLCVPIHLVHTMLFSKSTATTNR